MKIPVGRIHIKDSLFLNMFIATMTKQERISLAHSHTPVEIAIVLKGKGTYTINAQNYPISPGDLFFFGSNTVHYITKADCKLELLTLQFPAALLSNIIPIHVSTPNWHLFASPIAMHVTDSDAEHLQKIMAEIQSNLSDKPLDYNAYVHSLVVILAISLLRLAAKRNIVLSPNKNNTAILAALAYIENNFTQRITLQEAAAAAMLSPSYFSASFKRYTGYSLIDYTNAKRIRLAAKMLLASPNASISEIAMQVGYNNMSNFNRTFRKYLGCTPSKYIEDNSKPKP